jgi:hypothetical protein
VLALDSVPMRRLGAALVVISLSSACGASINAVYEGDVRFEHCMALDSEKEVKPTIKKACWEEWTKFYTFGQTRDRVDYAKMRMKHLGSADDFDEGDFVPAETRAASAVPEPTSALAPPPMMLATDAGTGAEDAAADAPPPEPVALPGSSCAHGCESSFAECRAACKTPTCEPPCTTKYKKCMRKCF